MALTATIYNFDIALADVDRGVYETLALRVARHPSESEDYLLTRVIAYCLEFQDGIAFSRGGLSDTDEPAITVRDLTGRLRAWVEVGVPDAARLHKAAKAAPRVAVYTHKPPAHLLRALGTARIHRAEALELHAVDRELLAGLAARLERRMGFDLSMTEGQICVAFGDDALVGTIERIAPPG